MIKYPSLTNHYRIENFLEIPYSGKWVVQEKIHGANISFDNAGNVYSRNQKTDENFCNASKAIQSVNLNFNGYDLIFGELFGPKIQKGVDYGSEKRILFYDAMLDGKLLTQEQFYKCVPSEYRVPHFGLFDYFPLNFDININSKLSTKENNLIEGVVIKPWDSVLYNRYGELFYIKKKNELFKEKQRKKKESLDDKILEMKELFESYIHPERLESVFSKEGRIQSEKELGKYIKLVLNDAKETMIKEENFKEENYTKKELKAIFNASKLIVKLLKKELAQ